MSVRVLFACWPFEGHVFPHLSVAARLRDRGHAVAFYTGRTRRDIVESEGHELFPLDRTEGAWQRVQDRERREGGRSPSVRLQRAAFREWLVESMPGQVADITAIRERFEPDVIVADPSMWGPGLIMREAQGVPVALQSPLIHAVIPGRDIPPLGSRVGVPRTARTRLRARVVSAVGHALARDTRRRIDVLRADHGLGPLTGSVNEVLGRLPLYVVASLPELDLDRRDLPAGVRYVGPLLWHPPEPQGTAEWLDTLPADRAWVHVTEGTSHYQEPFVLRAAAAGLAGAPYEAILTTGHNREPGTVVPGGSNVHVRTWLSHQVLLPRCSVLVTTGGAGTVMAGLAAGVPLVLVPTSWDKPDVALRMVEAGVAVRLAPKDCTPAGLRCAVDAVLGDQRYGRRAREVAERLAAAPGPGGAAELIEDLAARAPHPVGAAPVPVGAPLSDDREAAR
jgi:UDP:flavonoid glycosyltransferase YjiC (YdhE family)